MRSRADLIDCRGLTFLQHLDQPQVKRHPVWLWFLDGKFGLWYRRAFLDRLWLFWPLLVGLFSRSIEHAQSIDGGVDLLKPPGPNDRHGTHVASNLDPMVLTCLCGMLKKCALAAATADVVCPIDWIFTFLRNSLFMVQCHSFKSRRPGFTAINVVFKLIQRFSWHAAFMVMAHQRHEWHP